MDRKAVLATTLTLILLSMLTLAFNIQSVKSEPETWTVDDDDPADFSLIQEAINAANPEDTIFVHSGTYYENVIVNKAVSLIGENKLTTTIDGNMTGTVVMVTADNVAISGFTIRNGGDIYVGISLSSNGNNITNNIMSNNWCGISLEHYSAYNVIADNSIMNNLNGIAGELWSDTTITNNVLKDNLLGINTNYCDRNTIAFNNIVNHWSQGIMIQFSSYNTIVGNYITDNNLGGFQEGGIYIGYSSYNKFFHNNIIANRVKQVEVRESNGHPSVNTWDNGYPSGGNYWSDYKDRYPNATELDDSDIWNTPYVIDENNQDRYPLVKPWISPTERKVGVKIGDWTLYQVNYAYNTNDPEPPLPKPPSEVFETEQFKFFVQNVHNTNVTLQITTYYKDGSQEVTERFIDVNTGEGIPVFLIGANLSAGNIIYPDYWSEIRINETIPRTYLEVIRETNHYGRDTSTHHNSYEENSSSHIYWDRATGFITEAIFETIATDKTRNYTTYYLSSLQIIATNLWSPIPSTPVEATQELIETIETWNLPSGTGNSLKAKLKVAIHMLDMGKEDGAIRKLTAFINRVEMLREKTLTNEQADELVLEAQRIIDLING